MSKVKIPVLWVLVLVVALLLAATFNMTVPRVSVTHRLGETVKNYEVWEMIEKGASLGTIVSEIESSGQNGDLIMMGETLVAKAVKHKRADLVMWSLENGGNPNRGVVIDTLPLSLAVREGDPLLVKLLVRYGANPFRGGPDSAIAVARREKRQEVVDAIEQGLEARREEQVE